MKDFKVVIPVINFDYVDALLQGISRNTLLPKRVIIINNSKTISNNPYSIINIYGLKLYVITPPFPLNVNPSWNLGILKTSDCDFVSILNDDIEIPETFFENVANAFDKYSDCGVVCPDTVISKEDFNSRIPVGEVLKMKKKEGWAWTIRRELVDIIPPIHNDLQLFYGDDWYWWHTWKRGKVWIKIMNTIIYHTVGASVSKISKIDRNIQKKAEKFLWYDMKNAMIDSGEYKK